MSKISPIVWGEPHQGGSTNARETWWSAEIPTGSLMRWVLQTATRFEVTIDIMDNKDGAPDTTLYTAYGTLAAEGDITTALAEADAHAEMKLSRRAQQIAA